MTNLLRAGALALAHRSGTLMGTLPYARQSATLAGALACALLTTTCLTAPALAQNSQPSVYQHVDANGVDLTDGSFNFALVEGSIGAGEGAIALMRFRGAGGVSDNLTVRFSRTVIGTQATITLVFGNRSETFSGEASASSFTSGQGNGATLTRLNASEYRYVAADGTQTHYGPPPLLLEAGNNGFCAPNNESNCQLVAVQTRRPNGATTFYQWEADQNCDHIGDDEEGAPIFECAQFYRQRGLSNNSGYRLRFHFALEPNPTSGLPHPDWHRRVRATLHNDVVPEVPVREVVYGSAGAGITLITTDGGHIWRLTENAGEFRIRRPGSETDNVVATLDSNGRVTQVTANGVVTGYSRSITGTDEATMVVTQIDGDPNTADPQTTIVSDTRIGRPTSITDPLSHTTSMSYDGNGRPERVTAHEGNSIQFRYDLRGNVIETRLREKDDDGDPQDDIVTRADYPDECANVVTCNLPDTIIDARNHVTHYIYDQTHGGVTSVTGPPVPVSGTATTAAPQTRIGYTLIDGIHLPTSVSSCRTQASCTNGSDEVRTVVDYGANHLPTRVTTGAGDDSLSASQEMSYDPAGNLVAVDGPLDGPADTVHYRYDAARRLVRTISPDPDGPPNGAEGLLPRRAVEVTYRQDGQVQQTRTGTVAGTSQDDWAAFVPHQQVDIGYDDHGRPITERLVAGNAIRSLSETSYDALGRVRCTALRLDPGTFWLTTDACTQSSQLADSPDRIARTFYDPAGRATEVRTAVGTPLEAAEARTAYTPNGRVDHVIDGENNRTTYVYDGHDRLWRTRFPLPTQGANQSSEADADGDYEELSYDPAGNILTRRLRDGNVLSFHYDALGRLGFVDNPLSGSSVTDADIWYGYDLIGRLTWAGDSNGHFAALGYDALGRLTSEQSLDGGTKTMQYDLAGRRTRLTWPGGFTIGYVYNATGEMTAIRENPDGANLMLATFAYDDLGRRTSLTRGNGTTTAYGYDAVSRLQSLTQDLAGNGYDLTLGFAYNPASQIVGRTSSNDAYSLSALPASSRTDTHNGLNQIVTTGGTTVAHDDRGNMTSDGSTSYGYNLRNQLVARNGFTQLYYDPLGRLTQQWDGSGALDWVGGELVGEQIGAAGPRRYVHGPSGDEPLVAYEGSQRRWLHADERGSIVAHSDDAGNATAVNRYDEYGVADSGLPGRFGYTGQAWLPQVGRYYLRTRTYNPALGRFDQTDWIGYDDGMNMYAYVHSDPMNATDPSGTCAVWWALPVSAHAQGRSTVYICSDGSQEIRSEGTLTWRNNNPGNLRPGPFSESTGSIGRAHGFAVFPTYAHGLTALFQRLRTGDWPSLTIAQAIERYAPPTENDTDAYIAVVTQAVRQPATTRLGQLNDTQLRSVVGAIIRHEGFSVGRIRVGRSTDGSLKISASLDIPGSRITLPWSVLLHDEKSDPGDLFTAHESSHVGKKK